MPKDTSKPKKIEAAFFDVDNTIVRGSSTFMFGLTAFKHGFFTRKDLYRFGWQQFKFIRMGESPKSMSQVLDNALPLIGGHKVEDFKAMSDEVYREQISKRLWPETVRIAQQHVKEGREVWLVTAAPLEIAEKIAQELGLTGGLGTMVARENGIFTGKLVGKPLHGKAKRKAIKALAEERHISLKRSFAYSDSANDLPMLTMVGKAVAVNPDKLLEQHAKAAGWQILDFKKRELKVHKK
ncbi:MAG: HAD family hydrolase [Micrococcales bacterium]